MPTSGTEFSAPQHAAASRVRLSAWRGAPCSTDNAGGQSGVGQPEMLPPGPVTIGARSDPVRAFGPVSLQRAVEWMGNSAVCTAGRRSTTPGVNGGRTGDMAHLTTAPYFAFCSPLSSVFFQFPPQQVLACYVTPSRSRLASFSRPCLNQLTTSVGLYSCLLPGPSSDMGFALR